MRIFLRVAETALPTRSVQDAVIHMAFFAIDLEMHPFEEKVLVIVSR